MLSSLKSKLLEALSLSFTDLSEDRLLDILLDDYRAKIKRIDALTAKSDPVQEHLCAYLESIRAENERARFDPLHFLAGEYFFECDGRRLRIHIQHEAGCSTIEAFMRVGHIELAARPISREEMR